MTKALHKKLIREGNYIAEVEVNRIVSNDEWSPHLTLEDVMKLDDVRRALQQEDVKTASQFGQVYTLTPIITDN